MSNTFMQKVIDKVNVSEVLDKHTGEILSKPEPGEIGNIAPDIFAGISTLDIPKDISDKLTQPVRMEDIEIKPTGEIYLSHVRYRKMLNDAFGMGNWSLRPLGGFVKTGSVVCREYALYIKGKYAASAIGEQNYIESNAQMTWSDACEATKSNVIMRCCKDLGIGLEMWDKKFVVKFQKEFCVQVWRKPKQGKENKPQWRLKESEPFFDETGIVDPNKKQVPAPPEAYSPKQEQSSATVMSDGAMGMVVSINRETKENRKTKEKFVLYKIKLDNNIHDEYTASGKDAESIMNFANDARKNGLKVTLKTKGDTYNTITEIDTVEPDFSDPVKEARNNEMIEDDINSEPLPF